MANLPSPSPADPPLQGFFISKILLHKAAYNYSMKRDRKEISRLKRENLQLRKLLAQRDREAANAKEIIEEHEGGKDDDRKIKEVPIRCPKCKGDMELMDLGGRGIYKVCTNRTYCWHRERLK